MQIEIFLRTLYGSVAIFDCPGRTVVQSDEMTNIRKVKVRDDGI